MAYVTETLSDVGSVVATTAIFEDNVAILEVSGTYGTATGTWQASADGTNYANISAVRMDTLAIEQTPTLTDNTTFQWKADITGMQKVRFHLTVLGSGSIAVAIGTTQGQIPNPLLQAALSGNQAITGTMTITSASASALTVGANGSTAPVLKIDASTGTVATGLSVTGAASASGVALAALGGTNEFITIDGKGSGGVKINSVGGTGAIRLGGAGSGANATGLTVTPNTAASGLAVAVVSTGTDESMTINAKGSGTITLGSVSTGNTLIKNGLTLTDVNIVLNTNTGTKIGTATSQKLGFFNQTPVVQPGTAGNTVTAAAGGTNTVYLNTTFVGSTGSSAYTLADVITNLKLLGLIAA